jgi:hypothetical protein
MKGRNPLVTLLSLIVFLAVACFAQKADVPRQPDTVAMASEKVKELVLLMNTNQNGGISKQSG